MKGMMEGGMKEMTDGVVENMENEKHFSVCFLRLWLMARRRMEEEREKDEEEKEDDDDDEEEEEEEEEEEDDEEEYGNCLFSSKK